MGRNRSRHDETVGLPGTVRLEPAASAPRSWMSAPLGVAIHGAAIAALLLAALYSSNDPLPPEIAPLLLRLAPPPPSPLLRGDSTVSDEPARAETTTARMRMPDSSAVPRIPDSYLTPTVELAYGFEDGLDDGSLDGMPEGLLGGVTGGVPGGLVGGVVGGTGRALPKFPKPDVGPSPIRMPQPSYTEEAIRNNVTGAVVLRVVIDERGTVSVLEVLRSVPELDQEAIRVVESSWLFRPATLNGRPVPTLSELRVRFQLH